MGACKSHEGAAELMDFELFVTMGSGYFSIPFLHSINRSFSVCDLHSTLVY